eukprot:s834_g5.t1
MVRFRVWHRFVYIALPVHISYPGTSSYQAAFPVKIAGKQRGPWKGSRGQVAQASPSRCSCLRGDWVWPEDPCDVASSTVIFCFDSWQDLPGSGHRRDSQLTAASALPLPLQFRF